MSETTFFKSLHCPRRKETAPKAGTAGFSRLNNNLELITANLCSRGLAALSCTSKKLNGVATNAAEQRLVHLIQNKEIKGIQESIEDITKNQLTAIIFLKDNNIIDINEKDMYERQLLHRCFVYNQVALTRALIAARANVDVQDPLTDYTLLYMAAHIGCKAIVYDLLAVKADVHKVDRDERTVFHYVSSSRDDFFDQFSVNSRGLPEHKEDIIQALIDAKANPNAKDDLGDTPLHDASFVGQSKIVQALLDVKAKLDVKNLSGETPLQFAQINNNKEIIDILTKKSGEKDLYCTIL